MEATVSAYDGRAVIRLNGRFDFSAHREFRSAVDEVLRGRSVSQIEVDLGKVAYLDSSALGMLLMLRDKARGNNCAVALANCGGSVRQVLEIANFSKLFPIS
ncbi:MAG: STAS domain-containing protein [Betaproteobacteria bacterium]|nr:STAS domain-containing protein [Betaproteobacteria bacterium]